MRKKKKGKKEEIKEKRRALREGEGSNKGGKGIEEGK